MAPDWLAPTATVVAALSGASVGGWLGGRRSRKNQEEQHRFERQQALTEHGRDKLDDAIAALRFLQHHTDKIADGELLSPDAELTDTAAHYERFTRAIPYLADASARNDIELVHAILADAGIIENYSGADLGRARQIVWRTCEPGLVVLGRYLRGEPWEPSDELSLLRRAHVDAVETWTAIQEDNEADERKWRKSQAGTRKRTKPEPRSTGSDD